MAYSIEFRDWTTVRTRRPWINEPLDNKNSSAIKMSSEDSPRSRSTSSYQTDSTTELQPPLPADYPRRRSGPQKSNMPGTSAPYLTRRRSSAQIKPEFVHLRSRRMSVAVQSGMLRSSRLSRSTSGKGLSIPVHFQRRKSKVRIEKIFKVGATIKKNFEKKLKIFLKSEAFILGVWVSGRENIIHKKTLLL